MLHPSIPHSSITQELIPFEWVYGSMFKACAEAGQIDVVMELWSGEEEKPILDEDGFYVCLSRCLET